MNKKLLHNKKGALIEAPLIGIMDALKALGMVLIGLAIIYFAGSALGLW